MMIKNYRYYICLGICLVYTTVVVMVMASLINSFAQNVGLLFLFLSLVFLFLYFILDVFFR